MTNIKRTKKVSLQEYIENNPVSHVSSPISQYDETIFQLYECLDAIGFAGKMGYKDRALLKSWLSQIGLPMKEVEGHVLKARKHPHYKKKAAN